MPDLTPLPNPGDEIYLAGRLTDLSQLKRRVNSKKLFVDLTRHMATIDGITLFDCEIPFADIKKARQQIEANLSLDTLTGGIRQLLPEEKELTSFYNADFVLLVPPLPQFADNPISHLYNFPPNQDLSEVTTFYAFYHHHIMGQTVDSPHLHRYIFQPNSYILQTLANTIKYDNQKKTIHDTSSDSEDTSVRQLAVDPLLAQKVNSRYFNKVTLLDPHARRRFRPKLESLRGGILPVNQSKMPIGLQVIDQYYHSPTPYLANADLVLELIQKYSQNNLVPSNTDIAVDELAYIFAFYRDQVMIEIVDSHAQWGPDDNKFGNATKGYTTSTLCEANPDLLQALLNRMDNKTTVNFGTFKRPRYQGLNN